MRRNVCLMNVLRLMVDVARERQLLVMQLVDAAIFRHLQLRSTRPEACDVHCLDEAKTTITFASFTRYTRKLTATYSIARANILDRTDNHAATKKAGSVRVGLLKRCRDRVFPNSAHHGCDETRRWPPHTRTKSCEESDGNHTSTEAGSRGQSAAREYAIKATRPIISNIGLTRW